MGKLNKIVRDCLELIFLFIGGWQGLTYIGRNIAGHDRIVIVVLFFAFGGSFIVNLISQITISLTTTQKGKELILKRIKTFSIILLIPTIVFTLIFGGEGLKGVLFSVMISGTIWLFYILLNLIFIVIAKFFKMKLVQNWINKKVNKFILITAVLIALIWITIKLSSAVRVNNHQKLWSQAISLDTEESYADYINQCPEGENIEEAIWRRAERMNTIESYSYYSSKYPGGKYSDEFAFNKARLLKTKESVDAYMNKYPNGKYANLLKVMVECKCDSFIDNRDGEIYHTVKIGSQVWMAENLRYQSPNSSCYDNDIKNGLKYGRLYDWNDAFIACPAGWHLPDKNEWQQLKDLVGDNILSLKSRDEWSEKGNDALGFAAMPSGYYLDMVSYSYDEKNNAIPYHNISFEMLGAEANWWTKSKRENGEGIITWEMDDIGNFNQSWANTDERFSIRCVKEK